MNDANQALENLHYESNKLSITDAEAKAMQAQATLMEQEVAALEVVDNASYEAMGQLKLRIKQNRERVMAEPLAKKKEARNVADFMNDICKMIVAPFDRAENGADRKMLDYRQEINRKRQEEQRKADEKARQQAEEKRKAEIKSAEKLGDKEGAKNLKAAPIIATPPPPKTPEPPKIKGIPVRKIWKFTIVDEQKIPRKFFVLDETAIRKVVNALGDKHGIPGISAYQEECQ